MENVAAKLELSAARVDFGEVPVADLRVRGLTLKNTGNIALTIESITLETASGEFTLASEKPAELGPQDTAELSLVFQPADVGEELGTLTIVTDTKDSPHVVSLRGVGVRGGVAVSHDGEPCGATPDSISFGAIGPNQTVTRTITLRSAGTASFKVLSADRDPASSTEFSIDQVMQGGVTLAPGGELELNARYTPIDGGLDSGAFVITTDLADRPSIRIEVCGEGIAPAICARPVPLDFGPVAVGTQSTQRMTIESCGREPLVLDSLALANDAAHMSSADFSIAGVPALPRTMNQGESFEIDVTFNATALQNADGWVHAVSNAPEAFFPLLARGGQPCSLYIQPAMVTFNNVPPGTVSPAQAVLVANDGASACTVTRLAIPAASPEFRLVSPPAVPLTINAGSSISLSVEYAPPMGQPGPHTATLEIEGNGAIVPVQLNGNPTLPEGCQLEVVPTVVNFGGVAPGNTRTMGISVNNISDEVCTIRSVELDPSSDPAFSNTSSNFGIVFPGRSRQLSVTYVPTRAGSARGEMIIGTSDIDTPTFRVPLFATAAQSGICVTPRILPFGPTIGTEDLTFTITACGGTAITVSALDFTTADPEFSVSMPPALPFTLQAGDTRVVTIRYAPTDQTGDYAVITVRSNDAVDPDLPVEMTGGPEIVPTSAGRFLYYWSIPSPLGGDVMKLPLQGNTQAVSFWGPRSGKGCAGCHHVSPDGRYVALIEFGSTVFLKIIDTTNNVALQLPPELRVAASYFSWNPNVNTNPPYQFAYDAAETSGNSKIHIGSVFGGYLRELQGANDPAVSQLMPTWGPNGQIGFARGMAAQATNGGAAGFNGPSDIMLVAEGGGVASPVPGASMNTAANYYPAFSRDGRWIAYTFSASAQSTIAAADAQIRMVPIGRAGPVLTLPNVNSTQGPSSYPTWSVDGTFLSFSSERPGSQGWDIYLAPIDPMTGADGAAMNLMQANTSGFEHAAQWSP